MVCDTVVKKGKSEELDPDSDQHKVIYHICSVEAGEQLLLF